jgi:ubiquitin-conjugating enzyme E2 A
MANASGCLRRELRQMRDLAYEGADAAPEEGDLLKWNGTFVGPEETPWDGGRFKVALQCSESYPNKAPQVRFLAPVPFHPNIRPDGTLCVNLLQGEWTPARTLLSILIGLQRLLRETNANSSVNGDAATMFKTNRGEYDRRARECARQSG